MTPTENSAFKTVPSSGFRPLRGCLLLVGTRWCQRTFSLLFPAAAGKNVTSILNTGSTSQLTPRRRNGYSFDHN